MTQRLALTTHNDFAELQGLCEAATAFMEAQLLPDSAIYAADLAIEELISNIIKYGYDDEATHDINVRLALEQDHLVITIEDDGHPFDPTAVSPPDINKSLEERDIGGLGIHLVRSTCEDMSYRRDKGKNIVEVRVRSHADMETKEQPHGTENNTPGR